MLNAIVNWSLEKPTEEGLYILCRGDIETSANIEPFRLVESGSEYHGQHPWPTYDRAFVAKWDGAFKFAKLCIGLEARELSKGDSQMKSDIEKLIEMKADYFRWEAALATDKFSKGFFEGKAEQARQTIDAIAAMTNGNKSAAKSLIGTTDKSQAITDFFSAYISISGADLQGLSSDRLRDYLTNDIFIGVASAATGIDEDEFVNWGVANIAETSNAK